jgi:hypothetical protein
MAERYKPEYAKGQIIVCFKNNNYDMGPALGKHLGYELMKDETKNQPSEVFIYKTMEGKELEAQKKFSKYTEFVEWAMRIDIKAERREENLETLVSKAGDLRDECSEFPDSKYNANLNKLIDYIKSIKEPEEKYSKPKYQTPLIKARKKK